MSQPVRLRAQAAGPVSSPCRFRSGAILTWTRFAIEPVWPRTRFVVGPAIVGTIPERDPIASMTTLRARLKTEPITPENAMQNPAMRHFCEDCPTTFRYLRDRLCTWLFLSVIARHWSIGEPIRWDGRLPVCRTVLRLRTPQPAFAKSQRFLAKCSV